MWLGSLERVQLSALGRWNCQTKTHLDLRPGKRKPALTSERCRVDCARNFPKASSLGYSHGL